MRNIVGKVVENPYFEWIAGLILIVVSMDEVLEAVVDGLHAYTPQPEHALFLYGLALFMKQSFLVFPYLYVGIVHTVQGAEKKLRGPVHSVLVKVSENPYIELAAGVLLAVISGFYAEGAVFQDIADYEKPTTHHVLFLYGCFTVVKFLIYTLEGVESASGSALAGSLDGNPWYQKVKGAVHSFWFKIGIGLFLILVPFLDAWDAILVANFDHHHGAMIIGVVTFIKGIPDFYDAMEYLNKTQTADK